MNERRPGRPQTGDIDILSIQERIARAKYRVADIAGRVDVVTGEKPHDPTLEDHVARLMKFSEVPPHRQSQNVQENPQYTQAIESIHAVRDALQSLPKNEDEVTSIIPYKTLDTAIGKLLLQNQIIAARLQVMLNRIQQRQRSAEEILGPMTFRDALDGEIFDLVDLAANDLPIVRTALRAVMSERLAQEHDISPEDQHKARIHIVVAIGTILSAVGVGRASAH